MTDKAENGTLGTCDWQGRKDADYDTTIHQTPHVRRKYCANWRPEQPSQPAGAREHEWTTKANDLLRRLNREAFADAIDMEVLPHAVGWVLEFAEAYATQRADAAERDALQLIDERDSAEDALQKAHIALGGDGEWTAKLPPEQAPESGDLRLDVPALAESLSEDLKRITLLNSANLKARQTAEREVESLRTELREIAWKAFSVLTEGGEKYKDDPLACIQFAKEHMEKQAVNLGNAERELRDMREALESVLAYVPTGEVKGILKRKYAALLSRKDGNL